MKKVLLAILSCLYLVATSGMQVQHHYCMGHLKATTIGFHQAKTCDTCGMEMSSSECCHDESQWLKVKDNHGAATFYADAPAPFVADLPPAVHFFTRSAQVAKAALPISNHSPPVPSPDRNLLFCIFRI